MTQLFAGPSFTPKQVLADASVIAQSYDQHACRMLARVSDYVSRILTKPSPLLGRAGAVCPFVGAALLDNMITLTVLDLHSPDEAALRCAALAVSNGFPSLEGSTASRAEALRAVIILMPRLEDEDAAPLIESVQKALKPEMVERGLMIGEFFPGCTAPGLHNPDFRPANTPFSFLAIRRMAAADLPFLLEDNAFVSLYLSRFGEEGLRRLNKLRPSATIETGAEALQVALLAQSALAGGVDHFASRAG